MVIVELKIYGDFDILVTDSIWINESLDSVSPSLTGKAFDNDRKVDNAVRELKQYGFKKVKTKALMVGEIFNDSNSNNTI